MVLLTAKERSHNSVRNFFLGPRYIHGSDGPCKCQ